MTFQYFEGVHYCKGSVNISIIHTKNEASNNEVSCSKNLTYTALEPGSYPVQSEARPIPLPASVLWYSFIAPTISREVING